MFNHILDRAFMHDLRSRHLCMAIQNKESNEKEDATKQAIDFIKKNFSRTKKYSIEEGLTDCDKDPELVIKEIQGTAPDRVLVFAYPHIQFSYSEGDNTFCTRLDDSIADELEIAPEDRASKWNFKSVGCPNIKRVTVFGRWTQHEISDYLEIKKYKASPRYSYDLERMKSIRDEYTKQLKNYGLYDKNGDLAGPDFLYFSAELVGEEQILLYTSTYHDEDFNFKVLADINDWKKGVDTLLCLYISQLKKWLKDMTERGKQQADDYRKRTVGKNNFATTGRALVLGQKYPNDPYISYLIARCQGRNHREANLYFWELSYDIFAPKNSSFELFIEKAIKRLGAERVSVQIERVHNPKTGHHVLTLEYNHYLACFYEERGLLILSAKDRTREILHMDFPIIQTTTSRRNCSLDFKKLESIDKKLGEEILKEVRVSELVSNFTVHEKCLEILRYVSQEAAPYIGETDEKGEPNRTYQLNIVSVTDKQLGLEIQRWGNSLKKLRSDTSKLVILDLEGDYQSQWKAFFSVWKMNELKAGLSIPHEDESLLEKLNTIKIEAIDPTPYRYKNR